MIATFFPLPSRGDDASDTPVAAGLTTDKSIYFAGDPVELTAVVVEGQRPVTGYDVTGTVALMSKDYLPIDPRPVMFSPDPGKLGPGLMSARIPSEAAGEYSVAIQITGADSRKRPFSRVASTTFHVYPLRAKLVGFADRAIRSATSGRIMRLDIEARVEVYVAGTYHLNFNLRSADGKGIDGHGKAALQAGIQRITAAVDAKLLNEMFDQDGPYSIVGARLTFDGAQLSDTLAALSNDSIATQPLHLSELDLGEYSVAREIRAVGVEPSPSGKFLGLRAELTATTPGGHCSGWAMLRDQNHQEIEFLNEDFGRKNPGPSTFGFKFQGAKIAQRGLNGPLIVSAFVVNCGGVGIGDTREHRTQDFHASDFEDPRPEFAMLPPKFPIRVEPGHSGEGDLFIRAIGSTSEHVHFEVSSSDPRISLSLFPDQWNCPEGEPCWRIDFPIGVVVKPQTGTPAGAYRVRIKGTLMGVAHSIEFNVIVDPELAHAEADRAAAMAAAMHTADEPPDLPAVAPGKNSKSLPPSDFTAGVTLHKIHVVLVLDRSSSMGDVGACDFMKSAASRFVKLFSDNRDSVGIISFGPDLQHAHDAVQLNFPLSNHFGAGAPDTISKISCSGLTNTGDALEVAEQELQRDRDREAINSVILFTDGPPNGFTAKWAPTSNNTKCFGNHEASASVFAIFHQKSLAFAFGQKSPENEGELCSELIPLLQFPYVPELDVNGVPLTGAHALKRIEEGPFSSKILMDSENLETAALNQAENVARRLRSAAMPTYIYVLGFTQREGPSAASFREFGLRMANERGGRNFESSETSGLTTLTSAPIDFWPAFQRIRADILERARVR